MTQIFSIYFNNVDIGNIRRGGYIVYFWLSIKLNLFREIY